MATILLADYDAQARFGLRAARGAGKVKRRRLLQVLMQPCRKGER